MSGILPGRHAAYKGHAIAIKLPPYMGRQYGLHKIGNNHRQTIGTFSKKG